MTNLINTTPHAVIIVDNDGKVLQTIEKSNISVRLSVQTVPNGFLGEIPLTKTVFGEPVGLPEYKEGTFYIVSQLVKSALPLRNDLLVPAEVVRDSNGVILGCKSLGI